MMQSKTYKVQIIGEDSTFILPKTYVQDLITANPHLNTDYRIISIVGSQSSGKSTLLNAVFSTDFQVLDANDGIRQTTKGIWGATLPSSKLFVMDVEGVDSAERWEEGAFFEKSTSLFSLVMSHLLIINIWTHDVRRFSGSNLKLLQTIFEINFRLFYNKEPKNGEDGTFDQKRSTKKSLLIILRDFNQSYNLEKIKESIIGDIERIWDEIKKPEECKDSPYSQFFTIDFEVLADYNFEKSKFDSQAKELYQKFTNPSPQNPYFPKANGRDNIAVPFDALNLYMQNVWGTIRRCKDIDIPTQKILISDYRCKLIKNDILKEITVPGFEKLDANIKGNIYPDIKKDSEDLVRRTFEAFKSKTTFYEDQVVDAYEQELTQLLKENLLKFLKRQVKLIKLYINEQTTRHFGRFKEMLKKKPTSLYHTWGRSKDELLQEAKEMLQMSEVSFVDYDMPSTIEETQKEITNNFDNFMDEELKGYTENFFKNEMREALIKKIQSLFGNEKVIFWEEFNAFFHEFWKKMIRTYEENLKEGFNLSKKDSEKYILQLRSEVKSLVAEKINERKTLFTQYIKEIFDYHFATKDGQKRDWIDYSEREIEDLYAKAIDFCARVIDSFQSLEILEHKIKNSQNQLGSQDTLVIEDPDFTNLFTESECHTFKNILGEYGKATLEYARSQALKRPWYMPNILGVKNLLS